MQDDFVYNNEEESEMGQLHAIHLSMNAIASIRRDLELKQSQPGLSHCESCGDAIPEQRRTLVPGVRMCVFCQESAEHAVIR
jgi:phage/conjugal plasmid C-4 type zinc finger TraR family protein